VASWERPRKNGAFEAGKIMGNPCYKWENPWKIMEKSWENHGKSMENPCYKWQTLSIATYT
jgi:hypothetical protein